MEGTLFKVDLTNRHPLQWCVYTIQNTKGEVQYMGYCQFKNIQAIPDAKKHPKFYSVFDENTVILGKIHKMLPSRADCITFINRWLLDNPRPFMMKFRSMPHGKVPVRCVQTGEEFASLSECANQHGLSQSALSNHLRGNQSYLTVGGYTYQHIKEGVENGQEA